MRIKSYGCTHPGMCREHNEDFLVNDDDLGLYIVCDGLGGHAAGEVAAKQAAESVYGYIRERKERLGGTASGKEDLNLARLAENAIQVGCATVYELSQRDPAYAGMATTMTMLLVEDDRAVVAHVGDCRLFLRRRGALHQLTSDHTLVNDLYRQGRVALGELEQSPYAHVLTRCLGREVGVKVDTLVFDLLPDDLIVLSSDGLMKVLYRPEELFDLLESEDCSQLAEMLVHMANDRGAPDNTSVLVVTPKAFDDAVSANEYMQRSDEVVLRTDALKQLYIFQDLNLRELMQVMEITTVSFCDAGQTMINEGEMGGRLFIILAGEVEVFKQGRLITRLSQGSHFGEISLLSNSPRTATVKAAKAGRFLAIEREHFAGLITHCPEIGVKLLKRFAAELSHRLENTSLQLVG